MSKANQGNLASRYKFVPRVLIFLTCGDRILLLKGATSKRLWAGLYNGIGGHVERGEDILSAARRELMEESGIKLEKLDLVCIASIDVETCCGVCLYIFHHELPDIASYPILPSTEGTLNWIQIDTLSSLPLVEDLGVLIPYLRHRNWANIPSFVHYTYLSGNLTITFTDTNPSFQG